MYGKLLDGRLYPAPNPMQVGDMLIANPTAEMYAGAGYSSVELAPEPAEPGKIAVAEYAIRDGKIVQSWRMEDAPPAEPTPDKKIAALLAAIEGGIKSA